MMNCGIYKITNLITGDFYIGQSINIKKREWKHFSELRLGKHKNSHLQHTYNKYGEENFKFETILYCEPFELTRYEQALVDKWKPAYNIRKECVNSNKGIKFSDKAKINLSISHKGYIMPKEQKIKIGESNKGRIVTEDTKIKIGLGNKGKIVSKDGRERISKSCIGRKHTEETKQKMSETRKGHYVSDETKKKIANSRNKTLILKVYMHFISPTGEIFHIDNMRKFCRENGLDRSDMIRVHKERQSNHKGWKKFNEE